MSSVPADSSPRSRDAAILAAIAMPKTERSSRMKSLRKRVLEYDVSRWSTTFLATLADAKSNTRPDYDDDPLGELEWTVEHNPARQAD